MSELAVEWPSGRDQKIDDVKIAHSKAIDVIQSELILPKDERFQIAYATQAIGGSVLGYGEPGVAKTRFGEIVHGSGSEVSIQSDDTNGTLWGYKRPTDGGFNSGSVDLDGTEAEFFFDEISHLGDNSEALNKLWNSRLMRINNRNYDLSYMAIYGTSNFPERDERRVKPLGRALLSRFGMSYVVTSNIETASKIQQKTVNLSGREEKTYPGLLPPRTTRKALKKYLLEKQGFSTEVGEFITKTAVALNSYGIMRKIHMGDGRIGEGWANTALANRLVENSLSSKNSISGLEMARTAALTIGTLAVLDLRETYGLQQELTGNKLLDNVDKAVFERRLTAATAFKVAKDQRYEVVTEETLRDFVAKQSFVEADNPEMAEKIDSKIVELVLSRAA